MVGLSDGEIPCKGWLRADYFRDHKIVYKLDFDHNGKPVFAITAKDFVCPNNADGRVYIYRK